MILVSLPLWPPASSSASFGAVRPRSEAPNTRAGSSRDFHAPFRALRRLIDPNPNDGTRR